VGVPPAPPLKERGGIASESFCSLNRKEGSARWEREEFLLIDYWGGKKVMMFGQETSHWWGCLGPVAGVISICEGHIYGKRELANCCASLRKI